MVQSNTVQPATKNITASTTLTEADHAERLIKLNAATGLTATLPAATGTGNNYPFFVETTVTSNDYIIQVANATDVIAGNILVAADGGSSVVGWETAATSDTITLDGSTTGGIKGDFVNIQDVASGLFRVTGTLSATGTEATPFSAAVS